MQRILVVDDNRLVADTLGLIFRKNGFDVRTAYSATDALSSAREFEPQLMLCDIDMPGRDGIELMGDIGEALPACRILVLTGFYGSLKRVHERALTMPRPVGVLTKPCEPLDLLREAGAMLKAS
ncbi:Response regulator receiver domain-containing protein [Granulicella rosea]|uniref:Response regulator receiver domain-containing protein n=1 Tax=Granulicella rosea TaxID=474952 RepID=A0A239L5Z9_9BACT|nr:response regulator [Granulicella rosea]SNT25755.1 Response regulator receiver domain-containing protein [Granulicella rosea]